MHLYRVHPWLEDVDEREPYGPLFIPPGQGYGRWDNPDLYRLRYFSTTPPGAIAETFGSLARWSDSMFRVPTNSQATKALSTYALPDTVRLANLADPALLILLGVTTVTDITERNLRRTQRLAARMFESGDWEGFTCWSYYHPAINLVATWTDHALTCEETTRLSIEDVLVVEAARQIIRTIHRA